MGVPQFYTFNWVTCEIVERNDQKATFVGVRSLFSFKSSFRPLVTFRLEFSWCRSWWLPTSATSPSLRRNHCWVTTHPTIHSILPPQLRHPHLHLHIATPSPPPRWAPAATCSTPNCGSASGRCTVVRANPPAGALSCVLIHRHWHRVIPVAYYTRGCPPLAGVTPVGGPLAGVTPVGAPPWRATTPAGAC